EIRLGEEPAIALEPAKRVAGQVQAEISLIGDGIGYLPRLVLLRDSRAAKPNHHRPGLVRGAGPDVDLSTSKHEAGALDSTRCRLRQDQRPVAPGEMDGVAAAAEIS